MTKRRSISNTFKWHKDDHKNENVEQGLAALVRLMARCAAEKDYEIALSDSRIEKSRKEIKRDPS